MTKYLIKFRAQIIFKKSLTDELITMSFEINIQGIFTEAQSSCTGSGHHIQEVVMTIRQKTAFDSSATKAGGRTFLGSH